MIRSPSLVMALAVLAAVAGCKKEVACPVNADGSTKAGAWYADLDADGAGSPLDPVASCTPPAGHVANADDCDDNDPNVHPGQPDDTCDEVDNDCDGQVDEQGARAWYYDADGDGVGGERTITTCVAPAQFAATGADCDDADPDVAPGLAEICDGKDNDCSGGAGETVTATCYADLDDDGHGDPASARPICSGACAAGESVLSDDCDDHDPMTWTGAGEQCDGKDNDCVGFTFPDQGADCGWTEPAHSVATGSVYVVLDQNLTWADAADTCDSLGYRLLWVDSEGEATFVRGLLSEAERTAGAWTGVRWEACTAGAGFERVDTHYEPQRCAAPSAWETGLLSGTSGAATLTGSGLPTRATGTLLHAVCEVSP